ncbi:MAG: DUF1707 SHOCT-like domain-containing protein [Nocardioides sp.]
MSEHLRLSDAERDLAAADLGEHYALGRLSVEEHGERLDRIWAARTRGELGPIFADLPGSVAAGSPVMTPAAAARPVHGTRSPRRFRGLPIPLVVLLAVLLAVTLVAHLPLILIGLAVWFLISRKGCSSHAVGHPVRHR